MSIVDLNTTKMPAKAYKYINSVLKVIKHEYNDDILAIGVFGSISRGTADEFSDVDLLIIYKDEVPIEKRNIIYGKLLYLENIYDFRKSRNSFHDAFLYALMQTTGTFKSIFFTTRQAWITQNFIKIFQVNFIARLFVHQTSILSTVLHDLKWIWINKILNYDHTFFIKKENVHVIINTEMIRAFIVTLSLSLGALFITPLFKESTKFSVEAMKWSLLSLSYKKWSNLPQLSKNKISLSDISNQLIKRHSGLYKAILPYFALRKHYFRCAKLNLLAPFLIFYLFWKLSK